MKPIKTTCSKGSKSYFFSLVAFVALAAVTACAETYYFAGANHNAPAFTDPAQWTNATGVAATQFSLDDAYVLGSSAGNQLDTPTGDVVFGGGEMQLGTRTAGTLLLYASSIHFPFLRFGPGESVMLSYGGANTSNCISGSISVETAKANVRWGNHSTANRSGQVQRYDASLVGNSSAKIITDVRYPDASRNETLALAGDCSGFFGTISLTRYRSTTLVASWPDYWARLHLARENFDMPAFVEINTDCVLESSANTAILRALTLVAGGRLKIHSFPLGGGLVVTNAVTLNSASAGADILEVVAERRVGHLSTNMYPVFTVPLVSRIPWERFSVIGGDDRPLPVPDSSFAITTNAAAGTETLSLVEPPVVKLVVSDTYAKETTPGGSADPSSALDKAASWSDNDTPHSGAHYLLEALDGADSSHHTTFRTRNTYTAQTFEGDSLTLGDICTLFVFASKFSLPRLRLLNGSHLCNGGTVSNGKTAEIDAPVEVPANCIAYIGPYSAGRLALTDSVSGRGTISLVGSFISTSYLQGFLRLAGDNSGFLGRIALRQQRAPGSSAVNSGQYLEFSAENNLGGALPAFDAEALSVGHYSALTPLANVTLNASSNRGLYITDSGAVNVTNANTTLTLNWPLKVKGTMEKWGPGTFALGGPLTLDGSCRMEIRQGAVQPLAQDALNGLTLSFAVGGSLLFDLSALPSGGMRNLAATPFELGDGVTTLPIEVKGDRTRSLAQVVDVPLLTVAQSAKAAVLGMLPAAPHPYLGCKAEWTFKDDLVADTFTLGLSLRPLGTTIYMK